MNDSKYNNRKEEWEYLNFYGEGATYFGIVALNVVLTILTLGLYYPWAKAAYRKYLWNETEFMGSRFVFNGTGREMFKGFLIAYTIIIGLYVSLSTSLFFEFGFQLALVFYIAFLILIPFAIYGAWRYRISRTSWRGIYFSFEGNFGEFLKIFLLHGFLTIITLGLYYSWMRVKIQEYLFQHTRIGDLYLDFKGKGSELFGINFLAFIIVILPFGVLYIPIWIKNRFNFTIANSYLDDGEKEIRLGSSLQNDEAWGTLVVNGILLVVSAGLAYPWTFMRKMDMYVNNILIPTDFNFDNLSQTSKVFDDATGDEMSDIFDIDLDF